MICYNCGTRNPTNNRTCNICGETLKQEIITDKFYNDKTYANENTKNKKLVTKTHTRSTRRIKDQTQPVDVHIQKTNDYEEKQIKIQEEQLILQRQQLQILRKQQLQEQRQTFNMRLQQQIAQMEQHRQHKQYKQQKRQQQQHYKALAKCPRCGSTSLSGNKKGFGVGKAIIGVAAMSALGPICAIGAVAGNIGAKKVRVTCMKCGKSFKA